MNNTYNLKTCFLFPFQKFSRLKTELNIKSTDSAEGSHPFSGSSFDPKALNNAYNYADYDDVQEPPGMKWATMKYYNELENKEIWDPNSTVGIQIPDTRNLDTFKVRTIKHSLIKWSYHLNTKWLLISSIQMNPDR